MSRPPGRARTVAAPRGLRVAEEADPRAYGEDLAYIHDAGFTDFARGAAPGVLAWIGESVAGGGLVVDLGCGSGVWARALGDAGYGVYGVDISAAMIALARRRVPEGTFVTASLLRCELPACDAVTSLGECLNYLFDKGGRGPQGLARLFRRIYAALRPGGVFIFDVAEPGQVRGPAPRRGHTVGPDWAITVEVEEDREKKILTRRMTTFRRQGELYRRGEEVHRQRLYETSEIASLLGAAGFRARARRGYGSYRLAPAHRAFLARKP